ncbi:Kynureninase [Rhizobiales bacterium GAS191]|jgi:kynureninase|nr:Kynureninase [Rhizobiales bacterium GAS113]SEC23281.1 Kynureninase [Rhizobiales bacterium GAS188]SED01278.1 Kynureninase [Rhizobiales bacterium GAS191]
MPITRDDCLALDASDPLKACRARFALAEGMIYLDGNSLGALPRGVAAHVINVVEEEWGQGLIRSWNAAGWYAAPARIGAKLASLLGAKPHEVTVTESISINLFKLLVAAARMRPTRKVILAEHGNFPSDNHIVDSVARLLGLEARFVPAGEIAGAIDADTGVATLSHVNYRTAEVQDMAKVTAAAHAKGVLMVWDLAHSSGAVDLQLDRAGADFAVGCGYKFLNGGPGAPSHIFVAERHLGSLDQPLTGWFGHAEPFRFDDGYRRAEGIRHMLCSTPQMLSMAAFEKALEAFEGVSMAEVERKGRALGDLMIALYDEQLARRGCGLATLRDGARRGNHVSFTHAEGYAVMQALIRREVIGDFRAPDVMRFGFGPLYVRFTDIHDAVTAIAEILDSGAFKDGTLAERQAVT